MNHQGPHSDSCQPCIGQWSESCHPKTGTATLGMPSQPRSGTASTPLAPLLPPMPHASEQQPLLRPSSTFTPPNIAAATSCSDQPPQAPLKPLLYHTPLSTATAALNSNHLLTPVIDESQVLLPVLSSAQEDQGLAPVHAWVGPQLLSGCDMYQPVPPLITGTTAVASQAAVVSAVMVPVVSSVAAPQLQSQVQGPVGQSLMMPHPGLQSACFAHVCCHNVAWTQLE